MPECVKPPLPSITRERAQGLRGKMTDAEAKLWFRLRDGRLLGLKFRRQRPIPPYIADFYCAEAALVVELDGSQHNEEVDEARTRYLKSQGLQVLRFWDNDVLLHTDAVLEAILNAVGNRTLTRRCAPPSPDGRGDSSEHGR